MNALPKRGDEVDAWIKRQRDKWLAADGFGPAIAAATLNRLLDDYRMRSDYGLSLREEDDGKGDP